VFPLRFTPHHVSKSRCKSLPAGCAGRKLNLTAALFPRCYIPPPFDFPHSQQAGTCYNPP